MLTANKADEGVRQEYLAGFFTEENMNKKTEFPMNYDTYVFDLYGTLVDIHTDESDIAIWEKLAMFYGYYGAQYEAEKLKAKYAELVGRHEQKLKRELESNLKSKNKQQDDEEYGAKYAHESSPEIKIEDVFSQLFTDKWEENLSLCDKQAFEKDLEQLAVHAGQFFRVMSTEYVRTYPGSEELLKTLKENGKKVYLLSNAQRIFTAYEMRGVKIFDYFDDIFISSDFCTKKPDPAFFMELIKKHDIDTGKSLFVGNDSVCDIEGARNVGFDTFYINSNISPKDDMAENANYVVKKFTNWTAILSQ